MLSLIAVLPQPPLLVPELVCGAAAETEQLRTACRQAAKRLAAAADEWIAVGAGDRRCTVPPEVVGTFAGFGVDVRVRLSPQASGSPDPELALPLLIGGWAAEGLGVRIRGELVAGDASPGQCLELGARLAAECAAAPGPVGLLVVGDGAATHTAAAPGHLDERAGPFDAAVADALERGDPAPLRALDPELGRELLAAGRAPWQVLAGAAAGREWQGELLHSSIPYGVAYHVAIWTPR